MFSVPKVSANVSVSGGSLPFPLDPGEFWVTALKAIYGPSHVLLGLSPTPKLTTANGDPLETGPFLHGLVFAFGAGLSDEGGVPTVQVKLDLQDFKIINPTLSVLFEMDHSRPRTDCTLMSLNPQKIFAKFAEFANPLHWPALAQEFASSPISFFERNIEVFYPAGIHLSFNIKGTMGGPLAVALGPENLVNRHTVRVSCGDAPEFPPKNIGFSPDSPVELVYKNDPTTTVARIEKVDTIYAHVFNGPEEKWCIAIAEGALTVEWIREQVEKYLGLGN